MSALLEYAEQEEKRKGAEFSVLIPQTPDLFAFYRRLGYETRFYRHAFSVESVPAAAETLSASPVTAGGLASLRRANASRPFVQLNPKASQAVAEDLTLLKAECFATGRGYAVARKEKKQVLSRNCSPRAHKRPPSLFVESAGFTVASRRRATAAAGCSKRSKPWTLA